MKDRIEEGDIVKVDFTTSNTIFDAKVIYKPCATGDSWILKTDNTCEQKTYYVCFFEKMTLIKKCSTDLPF